MSIDQEGEHELVLVLSSTVVSLEVEDRGAHGLIFIAGKACANVGEEDGDDDVSILGPVALGMEVQMFAMTVIYEAT